MLDGELLKWNEILIHGDPAGLKSLARLLIDIADFNQDNTKDTDLPVGEREHIVLSPGIDISNSSDSTIIGRLDANDRFIPINNE